MTGRAAIAGAAFALIVCVAPETALAQAAGRFEVAVGPAWTGGVSMGDRAANETQPDGSPRALFSATTDLGSAPGIDLRAAVRLTTRLEAEATGSYDAPELRVATSADVESATGVTATERMQNWTIGGAALWYVHTPRAGVRTLPFVTGGAAYVRQLHDGSTLAQTGLLFDAGVGVKRLLVTRSGRFDALGVRADVRARVRPRAIAIDDRFHVVPVVSGSLFVRF